MQRRTRTNSPRNSSSSRIDGGAKRSNKSATNRSCKARAQNWTRLANVSIVRATLQVGLNLEFLCRRRRSSRTRFAAVSSSAVRSSAPPSFAALHLRLGEPPLPLGSRSKVHRFRFYGT